MNNGEREDVSLFSGLNAGPLAGKFAKSLCVSWPIVESFGVEIGSIWPNQRVCFAIYADTVEQGSISKWTIQVTVQDRFEVDRLGCAVGEMNFNDVIML